jgi:lambda family phage portal protein
MIATVHQRNGNGHVSRLPQGTLLGPDGAPLKITNSIGSGYPYPGLGGTGYANYGANLGKNALMGWLYHGGDADRDIGWNVQILRERSRDAFMGIPLASGAVETLDTNVIGEGLAPAPNVDGEALGLNDKQTALLNKELADKFEWWALDPRESDWEAKHSFYTLQHVAFQSMLLSGDCPVLFPLKPRKGTLFDLRLRVLEADRVRNPQFLPPNTNIFTGVELGPDGELLAYHIAAQHPLASWNSTGSILPTGQTFRVEPYGAKTGRRNMVLLMRPERPEQRRGVPILAVCLELLKQMGRYVDATVVGAVIQSYFTAFITSEFPDPTIFDNLLTEEQKKEICSINPYNVQLGPGIVNFMRPGHAVNFSNPTMPQATFGEFTISVAKFIGAALGIPYEVLLKQYNASYSASRAALLDFWKRVRKYRAIMIDQLCQPVYEEWLTDAIGMGRIENFKGGFDDPYIRRAMLRCIWTGASAGSLDPQKEVAAADLKVTCGFSTIERESAELNGSNYRDNIRQQSLEQDEFDEAGLIYPPYRPTKGGGFLQPAPAAPKPPPGTPEPASPPAAPPSPSPRPTKPPARLGKNAGKGTRAASSARRRPSERMIKNAEMGSGTSGRFYR